MEIFTRETAIWTHWKVGLYFSISVTCAEQRHGGAATENTTYAVKETPLSNRNGSLHTTCNPCSVSSEERDCKTSEAELQKLFLISGQKDQICSPSMGKDCSSHTDMKLFFPAYIAAKVKLFLSRDIAEKLANRLQIWRFAFASSILGDIIAAAPAILP